MTTTAAFVFFRVCSRRWLAIKLIFCQLHECRIINLKANDFRVELSRGDGQRRILEPRKLIRCALKRPNFCLGPRAAGRHSSCRPRVKLVLTSTNQHAPVFPRSAKYQLRRRCRQSIMVSKRSFAASFQFSFYRSPLSLIQLYYF